MREDWVKWIETEPCPFASSDLEKFSSGQKIEFLGQLLEENPIRYSYFTKIREAYSNITNIDGQNGERNVFSIFMLCHFVAQRR